MVTSSPRMSRIKSSDGRDDDDMFSGFWYKGTKHFSFVWKLVLCTCPCSEVSQHSKPKTPLVLTIRETRQSLSKQMVSSSTLGLIHTGTWARRPIASWFVVSLVRDMTWAIQFTAPTQVIDVNTLSERRTWFQETQDLPSIHAGNLIDDACLAMESRFKIAY